ncbi:MAG: type II toxin-antitoxin system RelE/ParE family toxin [Armatimonadetes bacterium]|nr:type II toxin-antitoxin system RelE/ParE family toxin [Armatimonadota bacterium]
MARYSVVFRRSVTHDLRKVSKSDIQRILVAVDSLSKEPRHARAEKLSGQDKYRVRQGNYRILYEINDEEEIVVIVRIGHRRDAYRRR